MILSKPSLKDQPWFALEQGCLRVKALGDSRSFGGVLTGFEFGQDALLYSMDCIDLVDQSHWSGLLWLIRSWNKHYRQWSAFWRNINESFQRLMLLPVSFFLLYIHFSQYHNILLKVYSSILVNACFQELLLSLKSGERIFCLPLYVS